jgi:hypothetical protein
LVIAKNVMLMSYGQTSIFLREVNYAF